MGFKEAYQKLSLKVTLANRSESTLLNYGRQVAQLSLHFNCLPEELLDEQIEDYLAGLARLPSCPSRSTFKHCVYGLRFYFRLIGLPKRSIALPSIKASKSCPWCSTAANAKPSSKPSSKPLIYSSIAFCCA